MSLRILTEDPPLTFTGRTDSGTSLLETVAGVGSQCDHHPQRRRSDSRNSTATTAATSTRPARPTRATRATASATAASTTTAAATAATATAAAAAAATATAATTTTTAADSPDDGRVGRCGADQPDDEVPLGRNGHRPADDTRLEPVTGPVRAVSKPRRWRAVSRHHADTRPKPVAPVDGGQRAGRRRSQRGLRRGGRPGCRAVSRPSFVFLRGLRQHCARLVGVQKLDSQSEVFKNPVMKFLNMIFLAQKRCGKLNQLIAIRKPVQKKWPWFNVLTKLLFAMK